MEFTVLGITRSTKVIVNAEKTLTHPLVRVTCSQGAGFGNGTAHVDLNPAEAIALADAILASVKFITSKTK